MEDEINIQDLSVLELQEKIDNVYESFVYGTLEERKILRKQYKELVEVYNTRVSFEAYKTTI